MSKHNKANKDHYVQGGRLSPDDMARERKKQSEISSRAKGGERVASKAPFFARGSERPAPSAPAAERPATRASVPLRRAASRPRSGPEE